MKAVVAVGNLMVVGAVGVAIRGQGYCRWHHCVHVVGAGCHEWVGKPPLQTAADVVVAPWDERTSLGQIHWMLHLYR